VLTVAESLPHATIIGVDAHGELDLDAFTEALTPDVRLVSVMLANNEVGTIQPLRRVTRLVSKRAPQAVVHTDAIQAVCWLDVAEIAKHAQLISVSAHKFGGPKGVGALVVRKGTSISPMLIGGGQERERRSGTQNVAGIVAMAEAIRLTVAEREETVARVTALRDRLVDGLLQTVPDTTETVAREKKIAGSAHVCFAGVENEALLYLLDRAGVCASAASACASGALQSSHVLEAMGVPKRQSMGAIRMSLGWATTQEDIDRALAVIPPAVAQLRKAR
jgi:cysteine desulfurase